jgi:precorrin-6B methylase 2
MVPLNARKRFGPTRVLLWLLQFGTPLVRSGPFKGMLYIRTSIGSTLSPKLLGTYESELRPIIANIIAHAPDRIIDIGAAEGYYAVGLARALPGCNITAFETEPTGRNLIRQLAALNAVSDRVFVLETCDEKSLAGTLRLGDLVIMDVEGAERDILSTETAALLAASPILLELHDFIHPSVASEIAGRFSKTHTWEEIWSRTRTIENIPSELTRYKYFGTARIVALMDETRPCPMRWWFMTPISTANPAPLS